MFTRQGRRKAIVAQAVVYLVAQFLSVNLLIVQMAFGEDSVVDNHIGMPGDSRNAGHKGRLSPDRSIPDLLRQRMEDRRGGICGQGEDVHFSIEAKDKKAGQYEPAAPHHPLPVKKFTNEGVSSGNTGLLTWNTEEVDAPKYFGRLSSRAIAVRATSKKSISSRQ